MKKEEEMFSNRRYSRDIAIDLVLIVCKNTQSTFVKYVCENTQKKRVQIPKIELGEKMSFFFYIELVNFLGFCNLKLPGIR